MFRLFYLYHFFKGRINFIVFIFNVFVNRAVD